MLNNKEIEVTVKYGPNLEWERKEKVTIGSSIRVAAYGENQIGKITAIGEKDGRTVIDFKADDGQEFWAYPDQIAMVYFY